MFICATSIFQSIRLSLTVTCNISDHLFIIFILSYFEHFSLLCCVCLCNSCLCNSCQFLSAVLLTLL